jgi:hypothetical protein
MLVSRSMSRRFLRLKFLKGYVQDVLRQPLEEVEKVVFLFGQINPGLPQSKVEVIRQGFSQLAFEPVFKEVGYIPVDPQLEGEEARVQGMGVGAKSGDRAQFPEEETEKTGILEDDFLMPAVLFHLHEAECRIAHQIFFFFLLLLLGDETFGSLGVFNVQGLRSPLEVSLVDGFDSANFFFQTGRRRQDAGNQSASFAVPFYLKELGQSNLQTLGFRGR